MSASSDQVQDRKRSADTTLERYECAKAKRPNPSTSDTLCETCDKVNFLEYFGFLKRAKNFAERPSRMGRLQHVFMCLSCPFCRHVKELATKAGISPNDMEHTWGVKRSAVPGVELLRLLDVAKPTRLTVFAKLNRGHQRWARVIGNLDLQGRQPRHADDDPAHRWELVRRPLKQRFDAGLLLTWLKDNEEFITSHGAARLSRLEELIAARKLRVLDVQTGIVVTLQEPTRYVALSYVWGESRMRLQDFHSRGQDENGRVNLDKAPKTIADAANLTCSLRERYLWVDSVCIHQDVHEDKATIVGSMDVIYSSAYVTVVAAGGVDANAGLARLEGQLFHSDHSISFQQHGRNVSLLPTPPSLEAAIQVTRWSTRGWTFQEQVLSAACVFFTEQEVLFKCGSKDEREAYVLESMEGSVTQPDRITFRVTGKPIDTQDALARRTMNDKRSGRDLFSDYARAVQTFSSRKLTYPGDRLDAFLGFLQGVTQGERTQQSANNMRTLSGLTRNGPTGFLNTLLWKSDGTASRIRTNADGSRVLPSWSWTGWSGPVKFVQGSRTNAFAQVLNASNIVVYEYDDRGARTGSFRPHRDQVQRYPVTPDIAIVLHIRMRFFTCQLQPAFKTSSDQDFKRYHIRENPDGRQPLVILLETAFKVSSTLSYTFVVISIAPKAGHLMLIRKKEQSALFERVDLIQYKLEDDSPEPDWPFRHVMLV